MRKLPPFLYHSTPEEKLYARSVCLQVSRVGWVPVGKCQATGGIGWPPMLPTRLCLWCVCVYICVCASLARGVLRWPHVSLRDRDIHIFFNQETSWRFVQFLGCRWMTQREDISRYAVHAGLGVCRGRYARPFRAMTNREKRAKKIYIKYKVGMNVVECFFAFGSKHLHSPLDSFFVYINQTRFEIDIDIFRAIYIYRYSKYIYIYTLYNQVCICSSLHYDI